MRYASNEASSNVSNKVSNKKLFTCCAPWASIGAEEIRGEVRDEDPAVRSCLSVRNRPGNAPCRRECAAGNGEERDGVSVQGGRSRTAFAPGGETRRQSDAVYLAGTHRIHAAGPGVRKKIRHQGRNLAGGERKNCTARGHRRPCQTLHVRRRRNQCARTLGAVARTSVRRCSQSLFCRPAAV